MTSSAPPIAMLAEGFDGDPIRHGKLYVQLHERKALGEAYHWALLLTDDEGEGATLHHCTDRSGQWVHEIKYFPRVFPTASTVCLAGVGFIPKEQRAEAERILDEIEILPVGSKVASGEPFNCRTWLKMAVHQLDRARVISLISDIDVMGRRRDLPNDITNV
ncbi:hypothetical protein ACRALDRAFT_2027649 [Sodiomyces alcalophilus JCM 7366]|uniref:uncharacterized protein n=1 Tax=Sodiomyces alcalophilus JCM 7366 TaxID=591952 RepID=UPI0039B4F83E